MPNKKYLRTQLDTMRINAYQERDTYFYTWSLEPTDAGFPRFLHLQIAHLCSDGLKLTCVPIELVKLRPYKIMFSGNFLKLIASFKSGNTSAFISKGSTDMIVIRLSPCHGQSFMDPCYKSKTNINPASLMSTCCRKSWSRIYGKENIIVKPVLWKLNEADGSYEQLLDPTSWVVNEPVIVKLDVSDIFKREIDSDFSLKLKTCSLTDSED